MIILFSTPWPFHIEIHFAGLSQSEQKYIGYDSMSFHEWRFCPLKLYNSIIISFIILTAFVYKLQPELEKDKISDYSVYAIHVFSHAAPIEILLPFSGFFYKCFVTVFFLFEIFIFSGNTVFGSNANKPRLTDTSCLALTSYSYSSNVERI